MKCNQEGKLLQPVARWQLAVGSHRLPLSIIHFNSVWRAKALSPDQPPIGLDRASKVSGSHVAISYTSMACSVFCIRLLPVLPKLVPNPHLAEQPCDVRTY